MARIHTVGWELNTVSDNFEIGPINSQSQVTVAISTAIKHGGDHSCRFLWVGAAAGNRRWDYTYQSNGNGKNFFRFYVYIVALPDGTVSLLELYNTGATNLRAKIELNTSRQLILSDGAGAVGSPSSALDLNKWYRVELSVFNNTGTSRMELDARVALGETSATSFAATTTSTSTGTFGRVFLGVFGTARSNFDIYLDDFAINDTTGSAQTSWPGAGAWVHMHPNGDGDTSDWTNGTGTDFNQIDEITPDDITSYCELESNGAIGEAALESATSAGITGAQTVRLVAVGIRSRNESAAIGTYELRVKSQSSGTLAESATLTKALTTWFTNNNDQEGTQNYSLVSYTNPQNGSQWFPEDLDTAQIGVESIDANPNLFVSTLWLGVEVVLTAVDDIVLEDPVFTSSTTGTVDYNIPTDIASFADSWGFVWRNCSTTPLEVGESGVNQVVQTGTTGTGTTNLTGLIPGCSFSFAPYTEVGGVYTYGDTVTSSVNSASGANTGACVIGGLI